MHARLGRQGTGAAPSARSLRGNRRWRSLRLALGGVLLATAAAQAATPTLTRFLQAPQAIPCEATPFGRYTPLAQDVEAMNLFATSGLSAIDEYRPSSGSETPPFVRVYRTPQPAALAGAAFQKAVSIDLDGDGRDEVVAAYKMGDGTLKLGVYRRGAPAAAVLFDTWAVAETFSQVELVAGDLRGTTGPQQQLGVLLRTPAGAVKVYVLTGDSVGGIAEMDGTQAGLWQRSGPVGVSVGFAAGALLLDGHDQLAVVSEIGFGAARQLVYDVLEYEPGIPALPIADGDVAIGSRSFPTTIGNSFVAENGGASIGSILKIEADAGDVVDTAAAELVLHVQFEESGADYIGQRLLHFPTTRNENNAIVDFTLFDRTPDDPDDDAWFDASRLVQGRNENGVASFEATIANVDATPQREIVLARANPDGNLTVSAYQPTVVRIAGFTFQTTGRVVNFRNTTTGGATGYTWNFGDGTGTLKGVDVTHQYASDGLFTVLLTAEWPDGAERTYSTAVKIDSTARAGGFQPTYSYSLGAPAYEANYAVANPLDLSFVNVAAGDMNRDGTVEVLTVARNTTGKVLRSRWWLHDPANPASFAGDHATEANPIFNTMTAMDLLASDFDGDSLHGTLGDECVQVFEPQLRQLVWLPPYFGVEQAAAAKQASWGKSTTGTTSSERRSGSYTSHDVSGYVGVEVGTPDNLPYTVEASVKFTAGHNWQKSKGEIHGEETSLSVDEGQQQTQGEALTIAEENAFDCYRYDVRRAASGLDPNSSMRMCARVDDSRIVAGSDAREWDTTIPATAVRTLGHKPAQWFPLHRDWSSLSLFKPVTTNTAFAEGHGADKLTDGRFDTEALAGAARAQPYVEIDLGSVREISNIRVFPAAGDAIELKGFRVYASRSPMSASAIPSGANVAVFAPETADDVSYDRWNIWTRDADDPARMLRARYIRLQHPQAQPAKLRVAEIQVFGDVHLDPPAYPQAVCDPVPDDGWFKALVWNAASAKFAEIQMRGDLLWSGAGSWPIPGPNDTFAACNHHGNLPVREIWSDVAIGPSATNSWNLSSESGSLNGQVKSFDSSTRVGAEFDFRAGFIVKVIAGAAYEFTKGITKETQNTTYWGEGLEIGGEIGGFADVSLRDLCRYRPRPYAYQLSERSDTGYLHEVYAVDYTVQEGTAGLWKRTAVPGRCYGDRIFANGFD